MGWDRSGRSHPGNGQHCQRRQSLAGAWTGTAAAIGIGQAFCGVAGRCPFCPLEAHRQRPETALARGIWGPDPADPQATKPQHRRPIRAAALADGPGWGPFPAHAARGSRSGRAAWQRQHHDQRIPAFAGGVLPGSLARCPGGRLPTGAELDGDRLRRLPRRGVWPFHPETAIPADPEHRFYFCSVC